MRVLVCGGRGYGMPGACASYEAMKEDLARQASEVSFLSLTLDNLHFERPITLLIEGDAPGADRLAGRWARRSNVETIKFPAEWRKYGRSAGHRRNQQMLDEGKPDLVVAFPGGRGTADMVRRAEAAGIEVRQPTPSPTPVRVVV